MGIAAPEKEIQYGEFCSEKKEGETPIIRHPLMVNKPLKEINKHKIRTTWEGITHHIKIGRGDKDLMGFRKRLGKDDYEKKFTWYTYNDMYKICQSFARACQFLGFCPIYKSDHDGDFKFLGIYSRNRPEWILSYLGSHANAVTVVTIYETLGDKAIEFILSQTNLTTALVDTAGIKKLAALKKEGKTCKLQNLITLDEDEVQEELKQLKDLGMNLYNFEKVIEIGNNEAKDVELSPAKPEDTCLICYTSGTTGNPKGAMVTHKSLEATIDCMDHVNYDPFESDIYFSFLPYAHIMESLICALHIAKGARFGILSGSTKRLMEDAQLLKPTTMTAVPRIFQRVHEGIQKKLEEKGYIAQKIFKKAIDTKIRNYRQNGMLTNVFWDNLVFKDIRKIMGGRLRFMLVGSAPMDPYLLDFLQCALSAKVVEGYGQTEDCAGMLITNSFDNVCRHLGGPGWANEVKLIDCKELDYTSNDIDPETKLPMPRGEICIRGPCLFKAYLNDIENTKKSVDEDGWLHTGDVGMVLTNHGNAIRIIDRVKNIFKLQQGEYVAPEKLENSLTDCKYVEQIFIYGDSLQNYLVAVVFPRRDSVIEFLNKNGIEANKENFKDYLDDNKLKAEIVSELEKVGKKSGHMGFEIVKKVYLSPEGFTTDNDLATPTMKIKRNNAKKYFKKQIDEMYAS